MYNKLELSLSLQPVKQRDSELKLVERAHFALKACFLFQFMYNLFSYPILIIQLTVSMLQLIVTNVGTIYVLSKLKGTQVLYFDQLVCTNRNILLIPKWNHLESKISTTNLHNH